MNDRKLNNLIAFSFIALVIFTAGNFALFHSTLRGKLKNDILDAELETAYCKMEYAILETEYYLLEQAYKVKLFDGIYFQKMYIFKDDYLGESHAAVSIFHSTSDSETLQFALDHAQHIIGRGDFIIDTTLNVTGDYKVIQDLRLWFGGPDISSRAPWYNDSEPWYNALGEEINKTTGIVIDP